MVEQQEPPSLAEAAVKDPTVFTWFTIATVTSTAIPISRSGHMKSAEVGGSERASYAISFYPYDANGTWRTGNYFAQASYTLDMRGTVSSSSSASYGYFYGYVQI